MKESGEKLPVGVKLGFGVCDLGGNLYFTVIAFWLLNFLTDTVGLAAALAGIVVMIGRIWDAVTDPLVGYLSDRTRSRWGRRRPYMFFGSFALLVTMAAMFTNPGLRAQGALVAWGTVVFCLLGTAYTLVNIPYSSLTPELTRDFHERTSLNGYRSVFMIVGTLLGAGAALPIVGALPNRNLGWSAMGILFGLVMMGTALITVFSVRERYRPLPAQARGFFASYLYVFRNGPFVRLLIVFCLNMTAVTVVSGTMIYYFKYIFGNEGLTTVGLMILLVTAMAFVPVVVLISRRIGKRLTYALGMLLLAAAVTVIFFLGHLLGVAFVFVLMAVAGVGLSTTYPIPWSMIPDTVEYGYLQSGERREGGYYGIWTFTSKIGQALAIGLSGWILSLTGYVAEAPQTELARLGIRLLVGPVTAVIFAAAALALVFYPLSEKRYNQVLEDIRRMESSRG